jgi:hypothetical protein
MKYDDIIIEEMTYSEAKERLIGLLEGNTRVELYNKSSNDFAFFTKSSIGKMLSDPAVQKSIANGYRRDQHYAAAAAIEDLFDKAIKLGQRKDRNDDPNVVAMHRFAMPVNIGTDTPVAVITVKESFQHGKRLYTIELMEIKKLDGILEEVSTGTRSEPGSTHFPSSSVIERLQELFDSVKTVHCGRGD